MLVLGTTAQAQFGKPLVSADISRLADTAHVEFKGLKNWRYEVTKPGEKKIIPVVIA